MVDYCDSDGAIYYCDSSSATFIVNFIMYGIVAALVYQFTRFMGEITVYSDI